MIENCNACTNKDICRAHVENGLPLCPLSGLAEPEDQKQQPANHIMTNFERITASPEALAETLRDVYYAGKFYANRKGDVRKFFIQSDTLRWLNQPAEA